MDFSTEDVRRIAHLARIEVGDAELNALHGSLTAILDMINDLSRLDTENVVPMAHAQPVTLPLRDDVVTEPGDVAHRDHYMSGAPAAQDGLFLVPKVIE
jgi:aspartyl/glutamyl-tRNA(Asn/Gln) amidotransferase, C subunit